MFKIPEQRMDVLGYLKYDFNILIDEKFNKKKSCDCATPESVDFHGMSILGGHMSIVPILGGHISIVPILGGMSMMSIRCP